MINSILQIAKPSTSMMSKPNGKSNLKSEALFGESFLILEIHSHWAFGKLQTDNYLGWIKLSNLGSMPRATHRIKALRTIMFSKPDIKSHPISYLPLGSLISITSHDQLWAEVIYDNIKRSKKGYVYKKHIQYKSIVNQDWISTAELLIGTPYKWGGRNSISLDCSALVQLSLATANIKFPRDTKDQSMFVSKEIKNIKNIKRGNLIYWPGHVAIAQNSKNIIHANAHHMMVTEEEIEMASKRIESECGPISKIKVIENNV